MLIRSQNKRKLIGMCELSIEEVKKNKWLKEKTYEIVDGPHVLGTYSTEEKALKVLDEIQEKYEEHTHNPSTVTMYGSVRPEFAYCPPKIYQMPKNEEV